MHAERLMGGIREEVTGTSAYDPEVVCGVQVYALLDGHVYDIALVELDEVDGHVYLRLEGAVHQQ